MTYLKYVVSSLAIAAGLGLSSLALAQTQANINWLPTGVDNWKSDPNWEDVGFGNFIPEAQYDDRAIIASGGTAQVIDSPPAVGGIEVNDGTLEITATGTLVSRLGDSGLASGRVSVGAAGTLRIAGGGTMSVGENANPANLSLGGVYSVELTAAAQNPISVAGKAVLGGALVADFNGATVTPSSTWKLIDATNLTGNFNSFTTSGATLPLGKVFNLQQTSGGTNGNLLQIGVEQRLVLNLNRDTKIASIQNVGTSAVSLDFDSYLVESAVGSISDQLEQPRRSRI